MQRLRDLMAHGGIATLAIVFALAFAAFYLAQSIADQVVSALQQHLVDDNGNTRLDVTVLDTRISFVGVLMYGLTVILVLLMLYLTWLSARRAARTCPECRSTVPAAATICRFCTTELMPPPNDA